MHPLPALPDGSWALSAGEVLEGLQVHAEAGLSPSDVHTRLRRFGPNRLRRTKSRGAWRMLWDQLASPIVVLLIAATAVAFVFDEQIEALAIAVVLVINTTIGFWTERRAIRSMEALRELGRVRTTVRRAGATQIVSAEDLVPGDIVLLEAGDVLTADLRLITASRLQVNESALTGESLPVDKTDSPSSPDAALSDRTCMAYKGTAVSRGTAEGVVVATGMDSELGQISRLVEEAEPETTPLEARLDRLGRRLILATLVIASFVAVTSISSGRELYLSIELALALAVAAVPEGLPIVATMALARGMWRMARRNALVKQLSAVETLGSTSVIITDKTGTLTENQMVVSELVLPDDTVISFRPAESPQARFVRDEAAVDVATTPLLRAALRIAALCNNAEISKDEATGDPTEVALLQAALAADLDRVSLLAETPEVREVAFDSDTKRMATLHQEGNEVIAAVKGAPECVLPDCAGWVTANNELRELDERGRAMWLQRASEMASRGHRVLALATRRVSDAADFRYESLHFLGLVGLLDPPRPSVRSAIESCQGAGIRVVMVTGDHGGTAWHIAEATGLIEPETGDSASFLDARTMPRFSGLSKHDESAVLAAPVIARATPRQKLDLIALYQRHGAVVAMTGDGVNDAPALKKADIGVAMGHRGTQVAREAANMVLLDDELETIVAAVSQGRAIFENIRKFVLYLMSCNVSEILAVAVASLAQGPLPLLPLQILFLNLVTDVFPALALGVGEGSPLLMQAPPRDPDEPLIARRHWWRIVAFGGVIALAVLGALFGAVGLLDKTGRQATTVSFLTLAMAQLWHVFNMRDPSSPWLRNEITENRWIWGAILLCMGLLALAVHWPPLASLLSISPPGGDGWALAIGMSLIPLVVGQVALAFRAKRDDGARRRTLLQVDASQ